MREPTYFIPAALQDDPLHGYAIIKQAEALSQGRVKLATGTLYAALDRLTSEGYVHVVNDPAADVHHHQPPPGETLTTGSTAGQG